MANVSSAVPRFTAGGLIPGHTYAVAVLAYNAKGRGDPYPLRASTLRPPEKHHVHDKSLDVPKTAFQMSGAMSAAVGGGGVFMVVLVLFMIAVRQRCTKRKLRSGAPSSQPASPDKLREKDDSESDDRNPDIIPSDTDHLQQVDYFRQQQVSTISPPNNRAPRGSIAGVRGSIPGYCPLRTAPPPSHPPIHDNPTSTPGIPPPAGFAGGSCTLPRNSGAANDRCIPLQHLRTLPRAHPHAHPQAHPHGHPHPHPHPPRDTPL